MSASNAQSSPKEAPWRRLFLSHLSEMFSPEFVLSTIAPAPAGSPTPFVPRARYCVFRGMWSSLPDEEHGIKNGNPRAYESDLPFFSTDVRMNKVDELFASSGSSQSATVDAGDGQKVNGSGGGGPVEAVWWANVHKDDKTVMSQWRMRGTAWVVGPDINSSSKTRGRSGPSRVKDELEERMRVLDKDKVDEWSWETELETAFKFQPPSIRGSFRNPPPGKPMEESYDKKNLGFGHDIDTLDDEVTRLNYRAVVIKPDYVEQIDLEDSKHAYRYTYTYDENSGDWHYEERWP